MAQTGADYGVQVDQQPTFHGRSRSASPRRRGETTRLLPETLNQGVREMKYDVRGEIYLAAQKRLAEGKEVIFTNVGNPHALGEKPLTFPRQVMALLACPWLLEQQEVLAHFPEDAVQRAKQYMREMKGGIGAYSDTRGHAVVRQEVADFIGRRDAPAPAAQADHIFLTNGAGAGVATLLQAMIRDKDDCILTPIPQYPLYSALVTQYGGSILGYHLDEEADWALDLSRLRDQVRDAKKSGKRPRALVLINPGNPTGSCLSRELLQDVLRFAYAEGILIIADEVYQENVYQPETRPFVSCRSALHGLGEPYWGNVELISLHSISKGTYGECGWRGGYFELTNIHAGTVELLYKLSSVQLSPTVPSQVLLGIMVNPPKRGEESHELYEAERMSILESLKRRAKFMAETFNMMEGVTCTAPEGSMYAFPNIRLPPSAVAAARASGKAPDVFYALALLEETGLSTVPGSGFGQADGSFHIRTTILPPESQMAEIRRRLHKFHGNFMKTHAPKSRL